MVPEDQAPELDGFYINKGELTFKRVDGRSSSDQSSSDESDGPQNTKSHKVCFLLYHTFSLSICFS